MTSLRIPCPHCGKALSVRAETPAGKLVYCSGGQGHTFPFIPPPVVSAPVPPPPAIPEPQDAPTPRQLAFVLAIAAGVVMVLLGVGVVLGLRALAQEPKAGASVIRPEQRPDNYPSPSPGTEPPPDPQPPPLPIIERPSSRPVLPPAPVSTIPAELQEKVNEAIRRGVEYLKRKQLDTGSWEHSHTAGHAALGGLTLLECGVPADDPCIQKAAQLVRKSMGAREHGMHTYSAALMLLFLERLGEPADKKLIRTLALRFVAGQNPDGGWNYYLQSLSEDEEDKLFLALEVTRPRGLEKLFESPTRPGGLDKITMAGPRGEVEQTLDALPGKLRQLPIFLASDSPPDPAQKPDKPIKPKGKGRGPFKGFPPGLNMKGDRSDNSNTQFAALALWAALRRGVPMERSLQLLAARFRNSQQPDGGWGYKLHSHSTNTMTGVGLLGLAIGEGLTPEAGRDAAQKDEKIEKGLAKLGQYIDAKGPRSGPHNLYFWWTVERVAVLYGVKEIAAKDWYLHAAQMLVENQAKDGKWTLGGYAGANPSLDTCFALLVLKRVNLAPELTRSLEGRVITGK